MSKKVDHHPKWMDTIIEKEFFDEKFNEILLFYVFNTPCIQDSMRGRTLQSYGWKDKPWKTNRYLKDKLDKGIFDREKKNFYVADNQQDLLVQMDNARLNDTFFPEEHRVERVVMTKSGNSSTYMSLFHHIRCALAHGRVAIYKDSENNDYILAMENIGKGGLVTARMILRESTLLRWKKTIENGPEEEEPSYYREVYNAMTQNPKIKKKELVKQLGETNNSIENAFSFLKRAKIINYQNHGRNSWWEIDHGRAEKCFADLKK